MKIDLWELGPKISAIRRLSVAAVNFLALNLQNRTAVGVLVHIHGYLSCPLSRLGNTCALLNSVILKEKKQRSSLVLNSRN